MRIDGKDLVILGSNWYVAMVKFYFLIRKHKKASKKEAREAMMALIVDNVENRGSDSGRIDTVAVGIEKKKIF